MVKTDLWKSWVQSKTSFQFNREKTDLEQVSMLETRILFYRDKTDRSHVCKHTFTEIYQISETFSVK
jgi:hypothetical protein